MLPLETPQPSRLAARALLSYPPPFRGEIGNGKGTIVKETALSSHQYCKGRSETKPCIFFSANRDTQCSAFKK